jgi:hypothetical protein
MIKRTRDTHKSKCGICMVTLYVVPYFDGSFCHGLSPRASNFVVVFAGPYELLALAQEVIHGFGANDEVERRGQGGALVEVAHPEF